MKRKDLTGKRYGKLVVEQMIYGQKIGVKVRTQCKCTCDCGNKVVVTMDSITTGGKVSCGCDSNERRAANNRKDLTGHRYGYLTVTDMNWDKRYGIANCVCDCGKSVSVRANQLTSGKTRSCGCLQAMRVSEANIRDWTGVVSPYDVLFKRQSCKNKYGQWLWECECGLCGCSQRSWLCKQLYNFL